MRTRLLLLYYLSSSWGLLAYADGSPSCPVKALKNTCRENKWCQRDFRCGTDGDIKHRLDNKSDGALESRYQLDPYCTLCFGQRGPMDDPPTTGVPSDRTSANPADASGSENRQATTNKSTINLNCASEQKLFEVLQGCANDSTARSLAKKLINNRPYLKPDDTASIVGKCIAKIREETEATCDCVGTPSEGQRSQHTRSGRGSKRGRGGETADVRAIATRDYSP